MIHIAIWGGGDSAATHVRSFLKYSGQCRITAVINHNVSLSVFLLRSTVSALSPPWTAGSMS